MRPTLPFDIFPKQVVQAILKVCALLEANCWIVGGTVRDLLLDLSPKDLDMTVDVSAELFCKGVVRQLTEGTIVPLGTDDEEACRVVWRGFEVDISSFRRGAKRIEDDMSLRDFTINSLAIELLPDFCLDTIIDPLGGQKDLAIGRLKDCPDAFSNDPLRILRGYRMQAKYGFSFAEGVEEKIVQHKSLLQQVAAERISVELDLILKTRCAADILKKMDQAGLLQILLPEIVQGKGVKQPGFHHLDVFEHCLTALERVIELLESPAEKSFLGAEEFGLVSSPEMRLTLCWAALLHDVGKPPCRGFRESDNRVTFYNHDQVGCDIVERIGERLRWSNDRKTAVGSLVRMHMHPFHLCTVRQKGELSKKAALKLYRRAEELLFPLFVLAMSDSLASEGVEKPEGMENELTELYQIVLRYYKEYILPVVDGEKLLTGKDLITTFELASGPFIGEILKKLQEAQVEGEVSTREGALLWAEEYIEKYHDTGTAD